MTVSSSCCARCFTARPCSDCSRCFIRDGAWNLDWNGPKHSRLKREGGREPDYMGEDKEPLVLFSKDYLKSHPDINYFIYGHRHIMLDLMLSRTSRMMILGDWITEFSYAVFDGENMFLEQYIEGETSV